MCVKDMCIYIYRGCLSACEWFVYACERCLHSSKWFVYAH